MSDFGSKLSTFTAVSVDLDTCNGCGHCLTSCPVDVFRLDPVTGKSITLYAGDCCVCFLCKDDCPTGAISIDFNRENGRLKSIYDILDIELPDWALTPLAK